MSIFVACFRYSPTISSMDGRGPHVGHTIADFLNVRGIGGWKFNSNEEVFKATEARCKELEKDGLAFVLRKCKQ